MPQAFAYKVMDAAKPLLRPRPGQAGRSPRVLDHLPEEVWRAFLRWTQDERMLELAQTPGQFIEQLEELHSAAAERRRPRSLPYRFTVADALLGLYPVAAGKLAYCHGPTVEHIGYHWLDPRPIGDEGPLGGGDELGLTWQRPDRLGSFLSLTKFPELHFVATQLFGFAEGSRVEVMPDIPAMFDKVLVNEELADALETFLELVIERSRLTLQVGRVNTGPMVVPRRLEPPPIWRLWREIAFRLWPDWLVLPEREAGSALKKAVQECIEAFQKEGEKTAEAASRFKLPHAYDRKRHNEICLLLHQRAVAIDVERLLLRDECQDRARVLLGDLAIWKAEVAMRLDVGVYSVANAAVSKWSARRTLPEVNVKAFRTAEPLRLIEHVEEALRDWSVLETARVRDEARKKAAEAKETVREL